MNPMLFNDLVQLENTAVPNLFLYFKHTHYEIE